MPAVRKEVAKSQFALATVFWATFIFALTLNFLQRHQSPEILLGAAASVGIGAVVGATIGALMGDTVPTMIWSILIAAFGYICVTIDPLFEMSMLMAWATTGAFIGAVASSCCQRSPLLGAILTGIVGGVVMATYLLATGMWTFETVVDCGTAPVIGVIVSLMIRLLKWLEQEKGISSYVVATALMIMIVVGYQVSFLSPY